VTPYILPARREPYAELEKQVERTRIDNLGELVYLFCRFADIYMGQHVINFDNLHLIRSAFDAAKDDFVENILSPYERTKRKANGTVYTYWGQR